MGCRRRLAQEFPPESPAGGTAPQTGRLLAAAPKVRLTAPESPAPEWQPPMPERPEPQLPLQHLEPPTPEKPERELQQPEPLLESAPEWVWAPERAVAAGCRNPAG